MMNVNTEKCIGCGACLKDCPAQCIELLEGKAKIDNSRCIKCAHCIAVCPKKAVSTDEYDMNEVKEYNKTDFNIEPENLMNFIKFRRSTRQFKDKEVEEEKLLKIIEAGRFTETAVNAQNVSYIVIKEKENLKLLKDIVFESLKRKGEEILKNLNPQTMQYKTYAQLWINMYKEYNKNPKENDRVFFNAPAVILAVSESAINASLASSNMELMTNAQGLGTFFSGFFVLAAQENKEIKDVLEIKGNKEIVTCMVLGYPDVKYFRTVPRKGAEITWK